MENSGRGIFVWRSGDELIACGSFFAFLHEMAFCKCINRFQNVGLQVHMGKSFMLYLKSCPPRVSKTGGGSKGVSNVLEGV